MTLRFEHEKGSLGSFSIVVPALNEAENMPALMGQIASFITTVTDDYEIVLVDDGSTDGTAEVARESLPEGVRDHLIVVRNEQRTGALNALKAGWNRASGDLVAYVDADLQFDAADLLRLLNVMPNHDMVAGVRVDRKDNIKRRTTAKIFALAARILYRFKYRDVDCGMKVLRKDLLQRVQPFYATTAMVNLELYTKAGLMGARIAQVEVPHYPRINGSSKGGRLRPVLRCIREMVKLRSSILRWH
jgi:dolichol-phosphate mannosyltransferase